MGIENDQDERPGGGSRRAMLFGTLGAVMTPGAVLGQAFEFKPNQRYPDPSVQILDPSFTRYRLFSASVEQLASGCRWAEGPVWFGDGRYLLFSDIPNNRIIRWDEATGTAERVPPAVQFLERSGARPAGAAARLRAPDAPHHAHRIRRRDHRARRKLRGKRFNSPNDIVCRSDGSIWFTDPPFGIGGHWEGEKATSELPHAGLPHRPARQVSRDARQPGRPERPVFSPDEKKLYVVEGRATPNRLSGRTTCSMAARSFPSARSWSTPAGPERSTASSATRTATCGAAGAATARRSQGRRARRRDGVQPGGQGDRAHSPARALRQPVLRRRRRAIACS